MFIVNGLATEDGKVYSTWVVDGDVNEDNFQSDWDSSLGVVQEQHPDDWNVDDVIKYMVEHFKWKMNSPDVVNVVF